MHMNRKRTCVIVAALVMGLCLFCCVLLFGRTAQASSRQVSSSEIRRAQRDTVRRYGANYYMYGAIRTGQKYYYKNGKYYRVSGR